MFLSSLLELGWPVDHQVQQIVALLEQPRAMFSAMYTFIDRMIRAPETVRQSIVDGIEMMEKMAVKHNVRGC